MDKISNDGSEIETLFIERIAQLIKPQGVAAVILPSSVLNKENSSFIGARESLLQNFNIRAIVQFGSKTFGATGTNTIVLFLEKFNEPPKRNDMVSDSIDSIFDNRDLNEWEDENILEGYLDKIGVEIDDYVEFVKSEMNYTEWEQHNYFKKYVEEFKNSTDVKNKSKQKQFMKLSDDEKMQWYNSKYYEYVHGIEKEKLQYFALVYNQMTLVVTAPDENKEQELFLGYKWSNRKGSEGIQILNPGGLLYDEEIRRTDNKISAVVRESFNKNELGIESIENYYYYLRLQDMIDFTSINFNKAIKTTKIREKKSLEGYTTYYLANNIFEISIGNRVVATDLVEDGDVPVYSANVYEKFGYINKYNIKDFSYDSVVWGIDGDWMVNVIPAGTPFYPTDHCGVIRIKSDKLLSRYLAIALELEGKHERFSRHNRASTQRIKALSIQAPDKQKQQEVIDEVQVTDTSIRKEYEKINTCDKEIKEKFVELFGIVGVNSKNFEIVELESISKNLDYMRKPVTSSSRKQGIIPYYGASGIVDYVEDYLFDEKLLLISEDGANLRARVTPIAFEISGKTWVNNHAHVLRFDDYSLQKYVEYLINMQDISVHLTGLTQPKLNQSKLNKFPVPIPDKNLLDDFIAFVEQQNIIKSKAQERVSILKEERETVIKKYFV